LHFSTTLILAKHLPGRHVTVTHEIVTVRTPGRPTEHRPLREGEVEQWLVDLQVPLTDDERTRLLEKVRTLTPTRV
jgi:N-hydroxyarylamine O-acetyltransferase